jgi:hypothetical protein
MYYPPYIDASFIVLVFALVAVAVSAIRRAASRGTPLPRYWLLLRLGLLAWLLATGAVASTGFFADFSTLPPRVSLAIVPAFVAMLAIGFSPWAGRLAAALSHQGILYVQSFRIVMEAILWLLYQNQAMPRVMTFEGRNFDLFTGVTALLLAFLWQRGLVRSKPLLVAWNFAGIAILALTVSQGLLSAPTRFQMIREDVENVLIGGFPFIWLPVFVVPFAFLLHILSLRKLRGERD